MVSMAFLALCLLSVFADPYDPHPIPQIGDSFIEGWYTRIVDHTQNTSFAIIFGSVNSSHPLTDPRNYLAFLRSTPADRQLLSFESFPAAIAMDTPASSTFDSPANFSWHAPNCNITTAADSTSWSCDMRDAFFQATFDMRRSWSDSGEDGPDSFIDRLPLVPLHWYVFSTASRVRAYTFVDKVRNQTFVGGAAHGTVATAHQEKNWGTTFPPAWIWAQASTPSAQLAMSGGVVQQGVLKAELFFAGVRVATSPGQPSHMYSFSPLDSIITVSHDACGGKLTLTARSLQHSLNVTVVAPFESFGELSVPVKTGFVVGAVESYQATATADLYDNPSGQRLARLVIPFSALEFGGDWRCPS